jgi:hypothetical protein
MDIFQIDVQSLMRLAICFGLDVSSVFIFILLIYRRYNDNREFPFTFLVFNVLIFFSCTVMSSMSIKMGFAFGLFAIFGILRYRTTTVPIKEMTYLLGVIVIAVVNAMMNAVPDGNEGEAAKALVQNGALISSKPLVEMIITNAGILLFTLAMEMMWFRNREQLRLIHYERIELTREDQIEALKADLYDRLGLVVTRVEIESMDLLKDSAYLKVYYIPQRR